jgi:hypothetical protein
VPLFLLFWFSLLTSGLKITLLAECPKERGKIRHGTVYLQSLPFSRLANRVLQASSADMGASEDQGSVLGGLGDLFGDN